MDANEFQEEERHRSQFARWLLNAWEWCVDHNHPKADLVAELVAHAEELDFPLWEVANKEGITGYGELAKALRKACGFYPTGAKAVGWEKEINYAPVVNLDQDVWQKVYNSLGWVNRYVDPKFSMQHFWLWSPAGNMVRFVMRPKPVAVAVKETEDG